tara:strand:+ start:532 stop:702 length:171 start_codon:yes stop_codon:yes gene_type:complete
MHPAVITTATLLTLEVAVDLSQKVILLASTASTVDLKPAGNPGVVLAKAYADYLFG